MRPQRFDTLPPSHPSLPPERTGVLLINLGTPEGVGYFAVRRYLKEFLGDRRVIETNPLIWKVILHLLILPLRPWRSGAAYAAIWDKKNDASPLRVITRAQCAKLEKALRSAADRKGAPLILDWAMRYGRPSIAERLDRLCRRGCRRILLFALYPQYSAATTATAYDKAFEALGVLRWQPAIRNAPPYYDEPAYIQALADSIREHERGLSWRPQARVISFHGLPYAYLVKGDPYHCQCVKTARLLREALNADKESCPHAFQSRFGRARWLAPYTEDVLCALAQKGVRRLAVVAPGFAADCVETLEELAMRGREAFCAHGGRAFTLIPCLNDRPRAIALLAFLIKRELGGWMEGAG